MFLCFPGGSAGKESACNEGDLGSIPGLGRSPGEGYGYPLQYSDLENSIDRGAWQTTVHAVAKSWTQLSDFTFTFIPNIHCNTIYNSKDTEATSTSIIREMDKEEVKYIYNGTLAIKRNKTESFVETWIDLQIVIHSEVRKRIKN